MFICNITGEEFDLEESEKNREGGKKFGYNIRQRAIAYCLTKELYGEVKILEDLDYNMDIKGVGLMDSEWLELLRFKINFESTYSYKNPFLNIYDKEALNKYQDLDFVVCSDVFQHLSPYPDIQLAFDNLYSMLKPGGFLVFSVPFTYENYIEKYPNLYDYKLVINGKESKLINTTKEGENEEFDNLVFYGSEELKSLEMRNFNYDSLKDFLTKAGFVKILFNRPDRKMRKHGIFWDNMCSLIITAFKPL